MLAPSPNEDTSEWLRVLRVRTLESGFVPTSYVEAALFEHPAIIPLTASPPAAARSAYALQSRPVDTTSSSPLTRRGAALAGNPRSPVLHTRVVGSLAASGARDTEL